MYGFAFLGTCPLNAAPVALLVAKVALEVFLGGPVTYEALEEWMLLLNLQNMNQFASKNQMKKILTRLHTLEILLAS